MCPERQSFARHGKDGFAIVAAIFILVVLASLGAYVMTISSAHHLGSALDIEGSRALQAARAGLDWGISRAVNAPTTFGTGNCQTGSPSVNLSTGAGGNLAAFTGYTVTVSCTGASYTDGVAIYAYALTATACNQPSGGACPNTTNPGSNYVERSLSAQIICNAALPC